MTPEDKDIIYKRIELSGLLVQDYITQCCKYNQVIVIGNVKTFDAICKEMKVIDEHLCRLQRADELELPILESLRAILEILIWRVLRNEEIDLQFLNASLQGTNLCKRRLKCLI